MAKRLKNYLNYLETLTASSAEGKLDKRQIKQEVLVQIRFFQHERLIHLIVTAVFAILTMLSVMGTLFMQHSGMLVLTVLFLVLLIPYIRHYYLLENGVQKMYGYYDQL